MTLQKAIKYAESWEEEWAELCPTRGSEDEPNIAGALTVVGSQIVYSYLTQGQILTQIWSAAQMNISVRATLHEAAKGKSAAELWAWLKPVT